MAVRAGRASVGGRRGVGAYGGAGDSGGGVCGGRAKMLAALKGWRVVGE